MKKIKIIYWIAPILFAGMMIFSGLGTFTDPVKSKEFMTDFLGYPVYFTLFISVAKILGGVALLIPANYPRIKEWAYAGLFFDALGAIWSFISVHPDAGGIGFMSLIIIVGIVSYTCYHQLLKHRAADQLQVA